jgi:hypothetical protein
MFEGGELPTFVRLMYTTGYSMIGPVCTSPIMEYPDYASEIIPAPATTSSDDDNNEPLVE